MKKTLHRRNFLRHTSLAALAILGARLEFRARTDKTAPPADLGELLKTIREAHGLPGIAAAAMRGGQIMAEGVAGVREAGKEGKIEVTDRFLIGSCTKRMTNLMICRLIDAGRLSFDITLAGALPDVPMRKDYRPVTVAQLVTFTGGIQPHMRFVVGQTPALDDLKGTLSEKREEFIRHVLQEEPVAKPGTERVYSNASYALLAFVVSRRMQRDWETMMRDEVFAPLRLASAGFGRPRNREHPHEPVFHLKTPAGYQPEPEEHLLRRSEQVLAGAGGVHCSVRDLAKFAAYELSAAQGHDPFLKAATARRRQELSPKARDSGQAFFGGSQSVSAGFKFWPDSDFAAAVTINGGGARDACQALFDALQKRFTPSATKPAAG